MPSHMQMQVFKRLNTKNCKHNTTKDCIMCCIPHTCFHQLHKSHVIQVACPCAKCFGHINFLHYTVSTDLIELNSPISCLFPDCISSIFVFCLKDIKLCIKHTTVSNAAIPNTENNN